MRSISLILILLLIASCSKNEYVATTVSHKPPVNTASREIDYQDKSIYSFNNGLVTIDNEFDAARLNDCVQLNDSTFTITILPENSPINSSPWYAFRIVSPEKREIYINIEYHGAKHRYHPKLSTNRIEWKEIGDDFLTLYPDESGITIQQQLASDTTWISAQEIEDSNTIIRYWEEQMINAPGTIKVIGESTEGRPLIMLDINEGSRQSKPVVVIMSRQHPPEVTGYYAMRAFVKRILQDDPLARRFLEKYRMIVFPIINPDGVDLGNWRHNSGGVDLNRDWGIYNQTEVRTVADRIVFESAYYNSEVVLGIDFHSTFNDIYYTNSVDPSTMVLKDFKDKWIKGMGELIPGDELNESASGVYPGLTTKNWFYNQFKAVGITFELGDNRSRDDIEFKGSAAAEVMMKIVLEK